MAAGFFVAVHSIRHMSGRNAPCHCGSGKKYKRVTGWG
ncbi:MAG: SEC-C domain-containing protein [Acidovorax sp.]|nr:SEC-C domain-containing protein [Acidovorax sp.]